MCSSVLALRSWGGVAPIPRVAQRDKTKQAIVGMKESLSSVKAKKVSGREERGEKKKSQLRGDVESAGTLRFPRFRRVGEEKSGKLSEGGDHGKTPTKLYQRIQARGSLS